MKKLLFVSFFCLPLNVMAGMPVGVPEIDGAGMVVAFGLVVSLIAIMRERFSKK